VKPKLPFICDTAFLPTVGVDLPVGHCLSVIAPLPSSQNF